MRTIVDREVLSLDSLRSALDQTPNKERKKEIIRQRMSQGGVYPVHEMTNPVKGLFRVLVEDGSVIKANLNLSEHFVATA